MDYEGDNLATLLERVDQVMVDKLHADLLAAGYGEIKPSHGVVFENIGFEGSRLTQMAERAGISKQLMQYLVDPLEQAGYLERIEDPTDGRAKILRITELGWEAVRVAEKSLRDTEIEFAKLVGADRIATLRTELEQLVARLAEPEPAD